MKALGEFIVSMALSMAQTIFAGFVMSQMWGWFIATRFGLPRLSYLDSVGLMVLVGFIFLPLVSQNAWAKLDDSKEISPFAKGVLKSIIMIVIVYPMALGMAFVWHLVIGRG